MSYWKPGFTPLTIHAWISSFFFFACYPPCVYVYSLTAARLPSALNLCGPHPKHHLHPLQVQSCDLPPSQRKQVMHVHCTYMYVCTCIRIRTCIHACVRVYVCTLYIHVMYVWYIILFLFFLRNVWKIFLDKGQYELAKKYSEVCTYVHVRMYVRTCMQGFAHLLLYPSLWLLFPGQSSHFIFTSYTCKTCYL